MGMLLKIKYVIFSKYLNIYYIFKRNILIWLYPLLFNIHFFPPDFNYDDVRYFMKVSNNIALFIFNKTFQIT